MLLAGPPTPSCALQVKTIPPQRPEAAAGRGRPCIKHPPAQVSPLNGSFQRCRGERFMGGITQLPGGARAALAPVSRPSLSMPDTSALVAAHPESSRLWCPGMAPLSSSMSPRPCFGLVCGERLWSRRDSDSPRSASCRFSTLQP